MPEEHPSVSAVGQYLDEQVEIAALAQQYYEEEGRPQGRSQDHWFRAEKEFRRRTAQNRPPQPGNDTPGGPLEEAMHLAQ